MDEQEREDFIKKIGIAVGDSDESEEEEEEDPENHKYSCKKCQVRHTHTDTRALCNPATSESNIDACVDTQSCLQQEAPIKHVTSLWLFRCRLPRAEST